jgi:lipopolysaccharide biosynthesis glycosyltransferase
MQRSKIKMKTSNYAKKSINSKKCLPIFLVAEKNDLPSLDVALLSIKDNVSPKRMYAVYILHEGMENSLQKTLSRHADKKFQITFMDASGYDDSLAACRTLFPVLCPKADKALYFNCNIVALCDIAELYNTAFDSEYFINANQCSAARVPKLLDYHASRKPWHYTDIPYQDYFWKYAVQSAFYEEFLRRLKEFVEEEEKDIQRVKEKAENKRMDCPYFLKKAN